MPDSNLGPLPQKSGALPMNHHIYGAKIMDKVGSEPELKINNFGSAALF